MIETSTKDNIIIYKFTMDIYGELFLIAEFEFFREKNKMWLNNCYVDENYQQNGIGTFMIKVAIQHFGVLYFSSAEKGEHKRRNIVNDTRYVEFPDGTKFLDSLLENNVIKKEWVINPFT